MRCDCEAVHCEHEPGACQSTVVAKVDWMGHRLKMCRVCINKAIKAQSSYVPYTIQIVQLGPLVEGDKT